MACCVHPDSEKSWLEEVKVGDIDDPPVVTVEQVGVVTEREPRELTDESMGEAEPVRKKTSISDNVDYKLMTPEENKQPSPKSDVTEEEILADESIAELPKWIKDQMVACGRQARRRANGLAPTNSHRPTRASTIQRVASEHHHSNYSGRGKVWQLISQSTTAIKEGGAYLWASVVRHFVMIPVIGACSCALTFYFNHDLGFTSVLASSMVGVLAHSFPSPYREVAFAATFGGMGGHLRKPGGPFTLGSAFVLGTVIGVVYILMESVFNGVGGKLGTIAFISGVACAAIGMPLGNEWKFLQEDVWENWTLSMGIGSVIAGTIGCLITQILMYKTPGVGSTTLASATVGLASIFLLQLHDEPLYGSMWSAFAYTGSFAGMTAKTRLMPPFCVLAGFLGSGILLLLWPLCPGVGGKYGLSALMAVLIVEFVPGARDPKYDPKTWFIETEKDTGSKRNLRRGGTEGAAAFGSLVMQVQPAKAHQPDWVDWIPPTTWAAVAEWLEALQKKEVAKTPSGKEVSDARLAQRVLNKHYGLEAPRVRSHDALEVRRILDLCCTAERRARPPPYTHADGEKDPTSVFASQWFRAVAQDRVKIHSSETLPLLKALEAEGVGLADEEVDLGEFIRRVRTRRRRREEKRAVEENVRSGVYS